MYVESLISLSIAILIHHPEIDHDSMDLVVTAVNTEKGTVGSGLEA